MRSWLAAASYIVLPFLVACTTQVAADLDESSANRIVVALNENGISGTKESDPEHEGRWRVSVPRDDGAAAVTVLDARNLPPSTTPGVIEALGEGSIVPSRTSEHARLIVGTAGDLERSLREVDGVLAVRVHLAVPAKDALGLKDDPAPPTASVLLRHQGAAPPLAEADVQRLVAGAVPGLSKDQVTVVTAPVPQPRARVERQQLAHLGPITVTRTSLAPLRVVVAAVMAVLLALLGAVLYASSRLRRTQLALETELSREDRSGAVATDGTS